MKSICRISGVEASGVKEGKHGLALIRAEGTAAAVFTKNLVRAAPVALMAKRIASGRLEGIIANSGCANAFTGRRGYEDAISMAEIGATAMGIDPEFTGVASTGVIGSYLDLDRIRDQSMRTATMLSRSEELEDRAVRAIMTTDLVPKHALAEHETFSVAGIAKGSGMIAPNMGTMLAFIYTDAVIEAEDLRRALKHAVVRSFNQVVVDGDTSTNDVVFCTATGYADRVTQDEFEEALLACCIDLSRQIAADGEGATKLIEMRVTGAPSEEAAARIARTIISSPLVKTAVHGEDPNWGRVVAAAGRAGVDFDPDGISLAVGEGGDHADLVRDGEIRIPAGAEIAAMRRNVVVFELDLGSGDASATAWGCDLSEAYVEINGKYTT